MFKFPPADCLSVLYPGGLVVLDGLDGGVKMLTSSISVAKSEFRAFFQENESAININIQVSIS